MPFFAQLNVAKDVKICCQDFGNFWQVLKSQAVASMGLVLEEKLEAFKGYLIFSEETGPLPYRVTATRLAGTSFGVGASLMKQRL